MATLAESLSDWSLSLRDQALPESLGGNLEWHALDTIGVLLAATKLPYARRLVARTIADGGLPEATLFGARRKVPTRSAVLLNGCLGHGVDWDDMHLDALVHPTAAIFPTVLAIAEARNLTGATLLQGLAVGCETTVRLGLAAGQGLLRRGLDPTSMCGAFGTALAAAHMLGHNRSQTVNTLGIAGGMCAGLHESVIDGATNKWMLSGIAAQAGYAAAELARVGFTAPRTIFEGPKGFFNAFVGEAGYDAGAITEGLGEEWRLTQIAYKAYACCEGAHPSADLALALYHKHGVRAKDVDCVTVYVGRKIANDCCEPDDIKRRPPNVYGAKFSIPFVIASALTEGRVTLDSFTEHTIADPERLALAATVRHVTDPRYDVGTALRGRLTVTLRQGVQITEATDACSGTPGNPWPPTRIIEKFRLLAEPVVGAQAVDGLVKLCQHMHHLKSLAPLTSLIAAGNLLGNASRQERIA